MITVYCLWAKTNNRTRGQFECNVTWFDFVRSHARCGCVLERVGGRGVRLKLNVQGQGDGKSLDVDGQGMGGLEN